VNNEGNFIQSFSTRNNDLFEQFGKIVAPLCQLEHYSIGLSDKWQ